MSSTMATCSRTLNMQMYSHTSLESIYDKDTRSQSWTTSVLSTTINDPLFHNMTCQLSLMAPSGSTCVSLHCVYYQRVLIVRILHSNVTNPWYIN